jgi:alkylresorcinol/alkylpyrone synthase
MKHRQQQAFQSTSSLQFPLLSCGGFNTIHKPNERDKLHFEHKDGKLRNVLHKTVPELSGHAVAELFAQETGRTISRIVSHTGGSLIIMAMEHLLPQYSFSECRAVMDRHGNMSSPSVMFVLEEMLRGSNAVQTLLEGDWWMVSFGAGFTCHSCRLSFHESQ